MKRLLLVVVFAFACIAANAQYIGGVAFDIDYSSNASKSASGTKLKDGASYTVSIAPQFGWMPTEKWMVGAAVAFDMSNASTIEHTEIDLSDLDGLDDLDGFDDLEGLDDIIGDEFDTESTTKTLGWSVAPFARYKVGEFGRFGVWMDAHLYLGMQYPDKKQVGGLFNTPKRTANYGAQICPMVSFQFNDRAMITLHISTLSLGWAGSAKWMPDDSVRYTSDLRMFSGKISGLLSSAITESWYGFRIGTIYKF